MGVECRSYNGVMAAIDSGYACAYAVTLHKNPIITFYQASSTDTVQFDLVFRAEDLS